MGYEAFHTELVFIMYFTTGPALMLRMSSKIVTEVVQMSQNSFIYCIL